MKASHIGFNFWMDFPRHADGDYIFHADQMKSLPEIESLASLFDEKWEACRFLVPTLARHEKKDRDEIIRRLRYILVAASKKKKPLKLRLLHTEYEVIVDAIKYEKRNPKQKRG